MANLTSYAGRAAKAVSLSGSAAANFVSSAKRALFYSPFDKLLYNQKYLSIVVDKDSASVCMIKMSSSGHKVISKNAFADTLPTPDELVSLLTVMAAGGSASSLKTILSVPKEWCVIRMAEFPEIAIDNISSAIAFQIPDLTPFAAADVYYDFQIAKREGGKLHTVIYAVKRQAVEPYIKALEHGGFTVESMTLSPASLISLLGQVPALSDIIVLVNVKDSHTELALAQRGVVTEVYKVKSIVDNIVKAISSIDIAEISVIINCQNEDLTRELKAVLTCHELKEVLPALNDDADYTLAAAAAIAISRTKTKCINMLSMGQTQRKSLPMALTIILSIAVIAMFSISLYIPIWNGQREGAAMDKQIKALKPEYERLSALQKDTKKIDDDLTVLNSMLSKRVLMLELLRELTVTLPQDTWLARIVSTEKDINIEGYAVNASALIGMLENSKFFKDVGTASTTFKDARMGKERFQIKAAMKQ
ncbi:MAG: PilN domain-containing protein [Candidatus Magnetominusculus sp. LBB02]|nr:PilN domain-containing protein [Candidatus Magnetominusculus sp. LBB02]